MPCGFVGLRQPAGTEQNPRQGEIAGSVGRNLIEPGPNGLFGFGVLLLRAKGNAQAEIGGRIAAFAPLDGGLESSLCFRVPTQVQVGKADFVVRFLKIGEYLQGALEFGDAGRG